MMNGLIRSLLLLFLLFYSGAMISQDVFSDLDRAYGLDPGIYNGKKYSYFLPSATQGNQFFSSSEFINGGVVVKGVNWWGLLLNYDVYNQKLLLQYNDERGAAQIIEVSEAWLEGFSLGTREFTYFGDNAGSRIYQVLGDGKYRVLFYWRKTLTLSTSMGSGGYAFSAPLKTQYVLIEGELYPFGSRGSFIKLFNPAHKAEIKNYLQSNRINLKKAPEQSMKDLINYISNLD
jgi:hypothetical protein